MLEWGAGSMEEIAKKMLLRDFGKKFSRIRILLNGCVHSVPPPGVLQTMVEEAKILKELRQVVRELWDLRSNNDRALMFAIGRTMQSTTLNRQLEKFFNVGSHSVNGEQRRKNSTTSGSDNTTCSPMAVNVFVECTAERGFMTAMMKSGATNKVSHTWWPLGWQQNTTLDPTIGNRRTLEANRKIG